MDSSSLADFSDDASSATSSSPSPQGQRVRPRAIASHIRPGAKVHPLSAYINSPAHTRALSAKPESQVLQSFMVCPYLVLVWANWRL